MSSRSLEGEQINLAAGGEPLSQERSFEPLAATFTCPSELRPLMVLEGNGFALTPVEASDKERIFDAVQDSDFSRWLPWANEDYSWEDAQSFAEHSAPDSWASGQPVWAIRPLNKQGRAGDLAGVIDLRGSGATREIGFWMHRDFQGQGLMTKAASLVVDAAFSRLPVTRVVHLATVGNSKSRRVARNIGFVPEGVRRVELPGGKVERQWQSALLRSDRQGSGHASEVANYPSVPGARVLPGSQPGDLVSEFHDVYGMPNRLADGAAPGVDFDRVHMRMSLIHEEVAELIEAVYGPEAASAAAETLASLPDEGTRDVVAAADALADLTYVIYGMALESGIDLDRVLAEVHSSNLSKLMPDGSVRLREDGKILKGPNFREPDIASVLKGDA